MSVKLNSPLELGPQQQRSLQPSARIHQHLEPTGIAEANTRVGRVPMIQDDNEDQDCDENDSGDCEDETVTELN
jgi:hypothetical protein